MELIISTLLLLAAVSLLSAAMVEYVAAEYVRALQFSAMACVGAAGAGASFFHYFDN